MDKEIPQKGPKGKDKIKGDSVFSILKPYKGMVVLLVLFALLTNALNLFIPKLVAKGIDTFTAGTFHINNFVIEFVIATFLIFIFLYAQSIMQTYASEKVARDLRAKIARKISRQSYSYVQEIQPSRILTTLTADIDAIKLFVSQAIVTIISSLVLIIGASILLLTINWRLALCVLAIIPIIGATFGFIFSKIKVLFLKTREVIDWLNKVINESILGAGIIRVTNAQTTEYQKFMKVSGEAKNVGLSILALFAALIPIITFVSGLATLAVVALGGKFVINGTMTLGNFTAFYTYIGLLIFPIIIIGFMSNLIASASASYIRIKQVLDAKEQEKNGEIVDGITGEIKLENISMKYGEKYALKDISFEIKAGSKTAIVGPTAGGKSQLLYLLTGLIKSNAGEILFGGKKIADYDLDYFHTQVALVFQDSSMFNLSIRENIAFSEMVTDADLAKAIDTAELRDFVDALPQGLDTITSERGTSLSGGQKQRIMLARALAINPKILFLDDFTARVDTKTEQSILANIEKNYPDLTLISVTQKINKVENYDNIIVLMEGELVAQGKHAQLLETSTEYVQIYNSGLSTNNYEIRT